MVKIEKEVSLKPFNTFGIDVTAQYFAVVRSTDELIELLSSKLAQKNELMLLGGGSNLLLTKTVKGLVIKLEIKGIKTIKEDDNAVLVEAGAGEVWHSFVMHAIQKNWAGLENLSLIPGCVGASPMQNIGAYGVEIKDRFEYLDALDLRTRKLKRFNLEECQFGYRESIFKRALKGKYIITNVAFKLSKNHALNTAYGAIEAELKKRKITKPTIKEISDVVIAIRQRKLPDPSKIGNSGSFFKNPIISKAKFAGIKAKFPSIPSYPIDDKSTKLPAGWLIERAGWKGKKIGKCGVHKNQALVLVNYGGATGKEIYVLSTRIIRSIKDKFGIQLEREVNIL